MREKLVLPNHLKKGDLIYIASPAGKIEGDILDRTKSRLEDRGYRVRIGGHARGEFHRFSGTEEERLADFQKGLDDKEVRAIFCSRGGYGAIHILDKLNFSRFTENPSWIVGFSDITLFHHAVNRRGIASLHADMPINFNANWSMLDQVLKVLEGEPPSYTLNRGVLDKQGQATGVIAGGNLAVSNGVHGSAFELPAEGSILFLEDVGEHMHRVERMLYHLKLNGTFGKIKGLIVGQFTEIENDPPFGKSLKRMIYDLVQEYDIPVLFDFPAGHIKGNQPLLFGVEAELIVGEKGNSLNFLQ